MHRRMLQTFLMAIGFLFAVLASAAQPPAFLVNSDWLEEHIDDPDLVLLEVRYHPHRYYTVGHIPGAVQVQRFKDLGDNFAAPIMRFPSREDFQATLRGWGVNDDSTIVLYDDSRTALTSRVYYLLELYGFDMDRVKLLNGSTIEWTAFNDLSKEAVAPEPGSVVLKEADPALYVEWTDVYDDVLSRRDPEVVLLDARPRDMYTGKVIQHAIQGGHIPGAINIVSLEGTDGQSQKWHSPEKLAAMYADIPKDKRIYVYCHDGFRMGLAYMQLKSLGYEDVKLYNGGWSHWGNELTLPVVEGDQPYDEAFAL
ncbi:sulfurtransferase [Thiohalomonas denitrificans]|uniref:Thiosulfate/3-mercaptopyruvate sulfurtransferase n=1 Tax=Thiohalomonas denitrificans TaxID=415747 RepID=A0A1G5R126_9GAMM|nr:rhodanese-like domain-containing protein [Thiohalomonas denitrificans]SCZ67510.1 thiosulfate/3-mercaptopyruvate sulfurtransferase [Thiohalomonas denitrificans]